MQNDNIAQLSLGATSVGNSGGENRSSPSSGVNATSQLEASSSTEAGPLPVKRGEIGYIEPTPLEPVHLPPSQSVDTQSPLPAVHPAGRHSAPPDPVAMSESPDDRASTRTTHSTHSKLLKLLKPKRVPTIGGVRLSTLGLFFLHLVVLTGTIAGWASLVQHLSRGQQVPNDDDVGLGMSSATIFVHVAFGVACLAQLIFLERRIFRIRAERYCYKHPGLPMHTSELEMSMGLAPWNRPPLPTYAAALAQSGVGTGDVEDNAIAIPPPPAYGNTRGSMLLLSGFMSNTLRAQRHDARERARQAGDAEGPSRSSWLSQESRPVSYVSRDEEWEERSDAIRAVRLGETLARLEESRVAS